MDEGPERTDGGDGRMDGRAASHALLPKSRHVPVTRHQGAGALNGGRSVTVKGPWPGRKWTKSRTLAEAGGAPRAVSSYVVSERQ